jgi:hypothetical protein
MGFHLPTIRPMRAETSSPSTAWTVPFSISAKRRRVSSFQAWSMAGSAGCNASVRRSTNSPTFSGGQWRASSTICSSVSGTVLIIRCWGLGFNVALGQPGRRMAAGMNLLKLIDGHQKSEVPHSAAKTQRPELCGKGGWPTNCPRGLSAADFFHTFWAGRPPCYRRVFDQLALSKDTFLNNSSFHGFPK